MAQPAEVTEAAQRLSAVYGEAWTAVEQAEAEAAAAIAAGRTTAAQRRLRLVVDNAMADAEEATDDWLRAELARVYASGAPGMAWVDAHADALQALAAEMRSDLLAATAHVRADVRRWVTEAARSAAVDAVAGQPARVAAREMARTVAARGLRVVGRPIWAVRYSDGSRHGLADYADTVIRTVTGRAFNTAAIVQGQRDGIGFYECGDGADCGLTAHDDGDKPNGRVYPAKVAMANLLSHPRCRRSWSPRPDVASAAEASRASPSPSTEQRADQAAAEAARAVGDRAGTAARSPRAARASRTTRTGRRARTARASR